MKILKRSFYSRDPSTVARELLGKILVREVEGICLKGKIVETEAYYGEDDPASRAYKGKKKYNSLMWSSPGFAFIYMVHANWLFNIVSHEKDKVGAVLIRALEPLEGIEFMRNERKSRVNLTNGPGRLTKALRITKELNGIDVTRKGPIYVLNAPLPEEIRSSHRIGVRKDLRKKLRFFIPGNDFVSKSF